MKATFAHPKKTAALALVALLPASSRLLRADTVFPGEQGIFTYENGVFTAIPFPALPGAGPVGLFGIGINNLGQIAGTDSSTGVGFLYSKGAFTPIAFPGAEYNYVTGLNDLGQVIGSTLTLTPPVSSFAFEYNNGVYTKLPPAPTGLSVDPTGINDSGKIVGTAYNGVSYSGFLFSNGAWSSLPIAAQQINNLGDIVADDNPEASILSHTGGISFLPNPPGCFDPQTPAINDAGTVVAFEFCSSSGGFVEWKNGSPSILNFPAPLGIDPTYPLAINDSGEIAGYFFVPESVPEPSFLLPLALLAAIAGYCKIAPRRV